MKNYLKAAFATAALAGCQTGQATTPAGGVAGVPAAAVKACVHQADNLWSAKPGTSVVNSAEMSSGSSAVGNWQLTMGTGNMVSTCTVDPIGNVSNIGPA